MFDVITFGSATQDIFIRPKNFRVINKKEFITNQGICFSLGLKIDIKDFFISSGGGGTNTAVTFANQGLKVAYCGKVGNDLAGEKIIEELKKFKIETSFVFKTKKLTNHSIILSIPKKDRTVLIYRGASGFLEKKDIPWSKLKTKWFYLAPLSEKLCHLFEPLVNFAQKNKIKVAVNPGNSQLLLPKQTLKRILKKIDILILNQEEASFLTKIPYEKEKEIFKKIDEICPTISIMTKGSEGVIVSDGKYLYQAFTLKSKVIDKTGAGDSFSAGFVAKFIKTQNIIESIHLGIANATSCLKKWGAKQGLLKENSQYQKVKVKRISL